MAAERLGGLGAFLPLGRGVEKLLRPLLRLVLVWKARVRRGNSPRLDPFAMGENLSLGDQGLRLCFLVLRWVSIIFIPDNMYLHVSVALS